MHAAQIYEHAESTSEPHPSLTLNSLNDDLLREIFDWVAVLEPYQRLGYWEPFWNGLGWIRLGHVCHGWRVLLRRMPVLWGRIALCNDGAPPMATRTLLRRSRGAPLDVTLNQPERHNRNDLEARERHFVAVMKTAVGFATRLRTLTASGVYPQDLAHFFYRKSLPMLQRLHIAHSGYVPGDFNGNFTMDACNLVSASFDLWGYGLPMASRAQKGFSLDFPNLRRLAVEWSYMSGRNTTMEDLRWIASAIRNAPLIEDLDIDLGFWHFDGDWRNLFEDQTAHLEHLKRLSLTQRSMKMRTGEFLAHICPSPPPSVTFTARYISRADVAPLVRVYEPYLRSAASYSTMYIRFRHPMWVLIHLLPSPGDVGVLSEEKLYGPMSNRLRRASEDNLPQLDRQMTLSLSTFSNLTLANEVLVDLAPRLHLANLTHLHIDGKVNPKGWWSAFRRLVAPRMSSVHTLIIDNLSWLYAKYGDMNALGILDPDPSFSTFDPPLPILQTLIITAWVTGTKARKRPWLFYLLLFLMHRKEIGLPIHTVHLRGGWMTDELRAVWTDMDRNIIEHIAAVVGEVLDERTVFRGEG
ncbi:hypothetical protein PENSPDRAFT_752025 [Peniophora sp. CONT]|nr:hypothetical protein PENSPDRAFT_752025 [Peniophora sp. CONT]